MGKSQLSKLTAVNLRIALLSSMGLLLVIAAVVFIFARGQLESYASQVKASSYAATVSSNDINRLQQLQQQLNDDKVAVTRAKSIVADSQYYQYQNQIISDINTYAKNSGVTISGYTFNTDDPHTRAQAAPPTAATTAAPAGLKTLSAVITVKNPVSYTAVMRFIHSIEINLTKMQLSGISIAKTSSKTDVNLNPLTIEVFVR